MQCIYLITCKINQKKYIGSTISLNKRWLDHKGYLRRGRHQNPHLQRAWNQYGENEFEFSILEEVEDQTLLLERELFWIRELDTLDYDKGYNICLPGKNVGGWKWTEEQRSTRSKLYQGRILSSEHKLNIQEGLRKARQKRSKLTAAQVQEIYSRVLNGERSTALALEYGVSKSTITDITKARCWQDVSGVPLDIPTPSGSKHHASKLDEVQVEIIKRQLNEGRQMTEIAKEYCVSLQTIGDIKYGRTWKHVS